MRESNHKNYGLNCVKCGNYCHQSCYVPIFKKDLLVWKEKNKLPIKRDYNLIQILIFLLFLTVFRKEVLNIMDLEIYSFLPPLSNHRIGGFETFLPAQLYQYHFLKFSQFLFPKS